MPVYVADSQANRGDTDEIRTSPARDSKRPRLSPGASDMCDDPTTPTHNNVSANACLAARALTWTPDPVSLLSTRLPCPLSLPPAVANDPLPRPTKIIAACAKETLEPISNTTGTSKTPTSSPPSTDASPQTNLLSSNSLSAGSLEMPLEVLLAHEALPGWSAQLMALLGAGPESWRVLAVCRRVAVQAAEDCLIGTRTLLFQSSALTDLQSPWTNAEELLLSRLNVWCRFMDAARSLNLGPQAGIRGSRRRCSELESSIARELDSAVAIATIRRHSTAAMAGA